MDFLDYFRGLLGKPEDKPKHYYVWTTPSKIEDGRNKESYLATLIEINPKKENRLRKLHQRIVEAEKETDRRLDDYLQEHPKPVYKNPCRCYENPECSQEEYKLSEEEFEQWFRKFENYRIQILRDTKLEKLLRKVKRFEKGNHLVIIPKNRIKKGHVLVGNLNDLKDKIKIIY